MDESSKPQSIKAFLIVANDLLPGIRVLSPLSIHPRGCALLASHVLECILKALLLHKGINSTEIYNYKARHNLECLWKMAFCNGRSVNPPVWVCLLSFMHAAPYYARYQQDNYGNIVGSGTYPPLMKTTKKLENLLKKVKRTIEGVSR